MTKSIYLVGGGKGGVGKSLLSMSTAHYFKNKSDDVILVETDTSNPDVKKSYPEAHVIDLDKDDGWIDLIDLCAGHPEHVIVINTAARNQQGVASYGSLLREAIDELKRPLVTLWIINTQRDSLELLKSYSALFPNSRIHVVRNAYFGDEYRFEFYNNSNLRVEIERNGGKSLTLPVLASRVANAIYINRISIADALTDLPFGSRVEAKRWVNEVNNMFKEIDHEK